MSFFQKLRLVGVRNEPRALPVGGRINPAGVVHAAANPARGPESRSQEATRVSNGLKEFLWNLEGLGRGTLLDLGAAWQTTLSFFIERGFRVTSDDLLRAWADFNANLRYSEGSFDAVLLWDVLDYLEPAAAKRVVASVTDCLRPGGVVFAMFHSRKPEGFQRYRVADSMHLQVLPAAVICPAQKIYQNREIQDLFIRYRTMKSFVGRDQLREVLFLK